MNYIDFDAVILDTYLPIFSDYLAKQKLGEYVNDVEYVKSKDWYKVLRESEIINNSIEIIKSLDIKKNCILTKIHSLENEGSNKVIYLREMGVKCPIILVPYDLKKVNLVNAKGNVLVDDAVFNLDDWYEAGGIPIFFNKDNEDIDGWGKKNTRYVKTRTLEILKKYNN